MNPDSQYEQLPVDNERVVEALQELAIMHDEANRFQESVQFMVEDLTNFVGTNREFAARRVDFMTNATTHLQNAGDQLRAVKMQVSLSNPRPIKTIPGVTYGTRVL